MSALLEALAAGRATRGEAERIPVPDEYLHAHLRVADVGMFADADDQFGRLEVNAL